MLRTPEILASWSACPVNNAGWHVRSKPFFQKLLCLQEVCGAKKGFDPSIIRVRVKLNSNHFTCNNRTPIACFAVASCGDFVDGPIAFHFGREGVVLGGY